MGLSSRAVLYWLKCGGLGETGPYVEEEGTGAEWKMPGDVVLPWCCFHVPYPPYLLSSRHSPVGGAFSFSFFLASVLSSFISRFVRGLVRSCLSRYCRVGEGAPAHVIDLLHLVVFSLLFTTRSCSSTAPFPSLFRAVSVSSSSSSFFSTFFVIESTSPRRLFGVRMCICSLPLCLLLVVRMLCV